MTSEVQKFDLYKRFLADRVSESDFPVWCESRAKELKVTKFKIRSWIAGYDEVKAHELRKASQTDSKRRAIAVGLTEEAALSVVRDALKATARRQLHDRNGDPTVVFETPDWQARLSAADKALKLHDSFPAARVELTIDESDPRNWTDEQLAAAAAASGVDLDRLLGKRAAGTPGIEGRAVLAPALYENEGRAEPGGPIPAVPTQALLPAHTEPDG